MFYAIELSTALSEVGWGLQSWTLLDPIGNEARARLELLETTAAEIGVSEAGWKVHSAPGDTHSTATFETLDHLLAHLSPAFENRRIKLLSDSLLNISVRRDWGEGEEGGGFEEALS